MAAGSGISEIKCIASGFTLDKFLSLSTYCFKSIGLPLAIASGLSVGKEGPSVHYATCVGSIISKLFATKILKAEQKNIWFRNILVASSAAGVAVAFGSPMGGVLFGVEEISNLFKLSTMWESYYCSLIAVATLQFIDPFRTGQVVLFEVTFDQDWHFFEIPVYILLGIFGGVYGIIVAKFNIKAVSFRKKYLTNIYLKEVATLAIITASISYFNVFLRMDMTESMQSLFLECGAASHNRICNLRSTSAATSAILSLLLATGIRMIFTIFTYGCKVPAGIFVPSMATGATFGRALGIMLQLWREGNPHSSYFTSGCLADNPSCITPGVYAFIGAGACLSGITHLTICVVVIMFELTGALKYIIPTMITVAVTKLINDKWGNGGIADQMIVFNGLPFIDPHEEHDFHEHPVSDAMTISVVSLPLEGLNYAKLKLILEKTEYQHFPIIQSASKPLIKGYITRENITTVSEKYMDDLRPDVECIFDHESLYQEQGILNFTEAVNKAPLTVNASTALENVMELFYKLGPRCLLVESDGVLQGLITRKDILKYEYYLHHNDREDVELAREQAFSNQERAWNIIQRVDEYITVKSRTLKAMVNGERRYTRL
jgi:chloride channel 3/4/5